MPSQDDHLREERATRAYLEAIGAAADAVAQYPHLWDYGDGKGGWLVDVLHHRLALRGFHLPDKPGRRMSKVEKITDRDGWTCRYCATDLTQPAFEIDHVIPRGQGGTDRLDNLVLTCTSCNRAKGNRTPQQWASAE